MHGEKRKRTNTRGNSTALGIKATTLRKQKKMVAIKMARGMNH